MAISNKKLEKLAELRKERKARKKKVPYDGKAIERNSLRFQKAVAKAAEIMINKGSKYLTLAECGQIAEVYRNKTDKITIDRVKRVFKMEEVQKRVNDAIVQSLLDTGITKERALNLLLKAEEISIETKKGKELKELAVLYLELLNEMPSKVSVTRKTEEDYTPGQLDTNYERARVTTTERLETTKKIEK